MFSLVLHMVGYTKCFKMLKGLKIKVLVYLYSVTYSAHAILI